MKSTFSISDISVRGRLVGSEVQGWIGTGQRGAGLDRHRAVKCRAG